MRSTTTARVFGEPLMLFYAVLSEQWSNQHLNFGPSLNSEDISWQQEQNANGGRAKNQNTVGAAYTPLRRFMATIGERIAEKAFAALEAVPDGLRYSDLVRAVMQADGAFKQNTVHGNIWNLDERFPDRVFKPSRGLFRLTKFRGADTDQLKEELIPKQPEKFKEEDFYEPFADWLVQFLLGDFRVH